MEFRLVVDELAAESVVATVHRPCALTQQIEELVLAYTGADQLAAFTEDDMKMIRFSEVELVFVEDGKTFVLDGAGERFRVKQRLYELEALLPGSFLRISKSALVNTDHLIKFSAAFSGAVDAVLRCGHKECVSRRCFAQIRRRFREQ